MSDWAEILWGFKNLFYTDAENFSLLSCKTKKFYSYKKYDLGHCQYQNKKALFTGPIFSEGFDVDMHKKIKHAPS